MTASLFLAQQGGYWLSGTLTVIAAAVVAVVILVSSRSGNHTG